MSIRDDAGRNISYNSSTPISICSGICYTNLACCTRTPTRVFHSHESESSRIRAYTCMTPSVPPLAYLTSRTAPPHVPTYRNAPQTPRQQEPENPSRRPSVSPTETSIKRLDLEVQTLALLWYRPCRGNLNSVLPAAAAVPAHRENFDVSSGLLLSCMWSCTMTRFRCVPRLRGWCFLCLIL